MKKIKIKGKVNNSVRRQIAPPRIVFADAKHNSRAKAKRKLNKEIKKQLESYP